MGRFNVDSVLLENGLKSLVWCGICKFTQLSVDLARVRKKGANEGKIQTKSVSLTKCIEATFRGTKNKCTYISLADKVSN